MVRHVLRASLTPMATMFGMDLAGLLGVCYAILDPRVRYGR